jgi:hypothetical protein
MVSPQEVDILLAEGDDLIEFPGRDGRKRLPHPLGRCPIEDLVKNLDEGDTMSGDPDGTPDAFQGTGQFKPVDVGLDRAGL